MKIPECPEMVIMLIKYTISRKSALICAQNATEETLIRTNLNQKSSTKIDTALIVRWD